MGSLHRETAAISNTVADCLLAIIQQCKASIVHCKDRDNVVFMCVTCMHEVLGLLCIDNVHVMSMYVPQSHLLRRANMQQSLSVIAHSREKKQHAKTLVKMLKN